MGAQQSTTEITQWLWSIWPIIKDGLNSDFTKSLLGALFGALAGAWGAQRIAERSKLREELKREISATNAAIAVAFGIANFVIGSKKQHVKQLKETFDKQKAEITEYKKKKESGELPREARYAFDADMMTLNTQAYPIETLRVLMFEKLSIGAKPLHLVMTLTQSLASISQSINKRNELIAHYKARYENDASGLIYPYFGFPYGDGHVNTEFADTIQALYQQTDDSIYFSSSLCVELHSHGKTLAERFRQEFKKDTPRVNKVSFEPAVKDSLMPDEKNYPDWKTAFKKAEDVA